MEIDVTKCRFYLDDGSCSSHDTDCTKCIRCYCDWKVHQEQLHSYKQAIEDIKKIVDEYEDLHGFLDCSGDLILQKISESEVENKN